MWNDGRLDKVYTIERFMRVGKANASNGYQPNPKQKKGKTLKQT
jgi:hypothetical protein